MEKNSVLGKILFWGGVVVVIRILLFVVPVMLTKVMPQ